MGIEYILTDKQFAQIEPLLREGFDRRGRKPAISDRDALEGIIFFVKVAVGARCRNIWALDACVHALQALDGSRRVVESVDALAEGWDCQGGYYIYGFERGTRSSSCSRGT